MVRYDVAKYSYIGRWSSEESAIAIATDLTYATPKDFRSLKRFKMGTLRAVSGISFNTAAFANAFDLDNMKLIPGYRGVPELIKAVVSGELHGLGAPLATLKVYGKKLRIICTVSSERSAEAPDIPTIYELSEQAGEPLKGEKKKWIQLREALTGLRRQAVSTPHVPKERLEFLRNAFMKVVEEKAFQAVMKEREFPVKNWARGDVLQEAA